MKTRFKEPALFISRTGASKAGIKVIAKLPKHIKQFEVIGPIWVSDSMGYHVVLISNNNWLS